MYKKMSPIRELPEIGLYFKGHSNLEKRGMKMAKRLLWLNLESDYVKYFRSCSCVEVVLNAQIVIDSFMIKKILGLCDCGVVDAMSKHLYLQYFSDFKNSQSSPSFNALLLTYFRKWFPSTCH